MPLAHSVDAHAERESCTTVSGRWSRSQHRTEDHPSPLRSKLRKKSQGHRSTGRLNHRDTDRVLGNRHVGGCCGHEKAAKPRPPHSSRSPPHKKPTKRRQQVQVVLSPSRKHQQMAQEREEEFANYRNLVEQRFTQMLEEEKTRMRRIFAEKKDLLE